MKSQKQRIDLPEEPKFDNKRERFLKKHKLGKYAPGYEPLIPWGYIQAQRNGTNSGGRNE